MNNIIQFSSKNQQFVSVIEVAVLTNKSKGNVLRDTRTILVTLYGEGIDVLNFNHKYFQIVRDDRGYMSDIYLSKDLTMALITGYSIELRYAVMKRWNELEEAQTNNAPAIPKTYAQALLLAAQQAEALELKEHEIQEKNQALAIAQPKVEFFNTVAARDTLQTATQVGLTMGMTANALNRKLEGYSVYDKRSSGRIFSSWFVNHGLGKMCTTQTGYSQVMFTTKGEQSIFNQIMQTTALLCEA
ncbi:phage regulatory protein/antirepressor Ant [Acinetobacter lwoffii]|uniref:phage antirepressor KilAC domain-containing protein n=1 Tax=Acinetobacter lwoffii TaxID=28090 RepID=UPI00209B0FB6|nr:phage antirepressor KilAC domain-containing protein [Acinetobacter lwoffii]MCO8073035.1 phage regulatory protein/antirepressor Ant [Acinetobacter lwoffii]MCO8076151.1 phage regulatory protein/antirepressor Ant [Acinetobacter lwoffii]